MSKIINDFIKENYNEIILMAKKITKDKSNYEDIAHYTIMSFYDYKDAEKLIIKKEAMKYMSGTIHRSYYSITSPWARKNKKHLELKPDIINIQDEEYDYKIDELIEKIETILNKHTQNPLIWFNLTLFKIWLEKRNFVKMSKELNIPRTTISNAVKEAKQYIKKNIDKL